MSNNLKLEDLQRMLREKFRFQPSKSGASFSYTEFYVLLSRINQMQRYVENELAIDLSHYFERDVEDIGELPNFWEQKIESFPEVVCVPRDRWGKIPVGELVIPLENFVFAEGSVKEVTSI